LQRIALFVIGIAKAPGIALVKRNELAINLAAYLPRREEVARQFERVKSERSINLNDIAATGKITALNAPARL